MMHAIPRLLLAAYGQGAEDLGPTDGELVALFSVSVAAVIGIFLYAARGAILHRGDAKMVSGENRDYEKYHSDWGDDYAEFGRRSKQSAPAGGVGGEIPDYYGILGVPRDATQAEIRARFRALAKQLHPDRSSGDPGPMAKINSAYEVLSDEESRRRYDSLLG